MNITNIGKCNSFISLLCLVLLLSGCSLTNNDLTDERLKNNENIAFFNKSGWQACAVGSIGGTLIGTLACSNKKGKNKVLCVTSSAVAGCGIGVGVNTYLDYQRSKYHTTEERLYATLIDIRRDNAKLQELTTSAKAVISDNRKFLVHLQKDIANNKLDKRNTENKIAQIDANLYLLNNSVTQIKEREKQWSSIKHIESKQANNKETKKSVAMLDKEINKMRHQVTLLQNEIDGLYSIRSAIKVS